MPVLCVAVGRRLGYPLKLAAAKGHLFFRWEDAKERRNFECTHAVNCISDEEYRKWPFPITDEEIEKGHYLRDFTPKEELACFLSIRAQVQAFHSEISEALLSQTRATLLRPKHPDLEAGLRHLMNRQVSEPGMQTVTLMMPQQASDTDEAAQAIFEAVQMSRNHHIPGDPVPGSFVGQSPDVYRNPNIPRDPVPGVPILPSNQR